MRGCIQTYEIYQSATILSIEREGGREGGKERERKHVHRYHETHRCMYKHTACMNTHIQ